MGRRYADIRRGGELKTALDAKADWDANKNGARKTKRLTGGTGKRQPKEIVGIYPFTAKAVVGAEMYLVRIQKASFDDTANFAYTEAAKYFDKTPGAADRKIGDRPSGFSPARLTAATSTATGDTFTYKQAKATKLWYPDLPVVRRHFPIGRLFSAPETGDEKEVKKALRLALATAVGGGKSISFKDEKMGGTT